MAVCALWGALGCASGANDALDSATRAESPWAATAVELFDSMADALDGTDHVAVARFFSAGGSLDMTAWGLSIATTPEQIDRVIQKMWFMQGPMAGRATVEVEQLFVARDGAVVRWFAYDLGGVQQWVQVYAMGDDSRITSRVYEVSDEAFYEPGSTSTGTVELLRGLYRRYVEVWSSQEAVELADVYSTSATVRDGLTGRGWSGLAEIADRMGAVDALQVGPTPGVWVYQRGGRIEAIAVLQLEGDCPRLEARRWIVESGRIVDETLYTHVLSARRCGDPKTPGWWDSFEAPTGFDGAVNFEIDVEDRSVSLARYDGAFAAAASTSFGVVSGVRWKLTLPLALISSDSAVAPAPAGTAWAASRRLVPPSLNSSHADHDPRAAHNGLSMTDGRVTDDQIALLVGHASSRRGSLHLDGGVTAATGLITGEVDHRAPGSRKGPTAGADLGDHRGRRTPDTCGSTAEYRRLCAARSRSSG